MAGFGLVLVLGVSDGCVGRMNMLWRSETETSRNNGKGSTVPGRELEIVVWQRWERSRRRLRWGYSTLAPDFGPLDQSFERGRERERENINKKCVKQPCLFTVYVSRKMLQLVTILLRRKNANNSQIVCEVLLHILSRRE
jgi:hypothetical protein